ncbi:MAG: TIGR02300 family protein [Deltaproteobacteria bacterium]|nr:MAG: TIGR02300 family protein [Deltaproteobacteria bacterium]
MADLGKKYTCYACGIKFYDLKRPEPICPKCHANQREAPKRPSKAAVKREPAPPPDEFELEGDLDIEEVTDNEDEAEIFEDDSDSDYDA